MFIAILAMGEKGELGKDNTMPWGRALKSDLQFVSTVTTGHNLLMGANTFNSLPKILKERKHFVVTSSVDILDNKYAPDNENIVIVKDLKAFIAEHKDDDEIFYVFGGASIYKQMIPFCTKVFLTKIHSVFPGSDVYINPSIFDKYFTFSVMRRIQNENGYSYTRYCLKKK